MTGNDWRRLPYGHMKPYEPWGNVAKMNFYLIYLCDHLREELNTPLYVTYGTQGVHKAPWHDRGLAVDAVVDTAKIHPLDVILAVTRFNFIGFGLIANARHPKCAQPLGLHLDVRPVKKVVEPQHRWIWYDGKEYPFTNAELKKHCLI